MVAELPCFLVVGCSIFVCVLLLSNKPSVLPCLAAGLWGKERERGGGKGEREGERGEEREGERVEGRERGRKGRRGRGRERGSEMRGEMGEKYNEKEGEMERERDREEVSHKPCYTRHTSSRGPGPHHTSLTG